MADVLKFPNRTQCPLTVHEGDPRNPVPAPTGANAVVIKLNGVEIAWAWASPIVDRSVLHDHAFSFVDDVAAIMPAAMVSALVDA